MKNRTTQNFRDQDFVVPIFLHSGIGTWRVHEVTYWTKTPDKIMHQLHLDPEVKTRLNFSKCNLNYDAYLEECFLRVSRVTKFWQPEPNKPECLAPYTFHKRRSKKAERIGVSKVSLELRANKKNESIPFWDLINFYIQSYTHSTFVHCLWLELKIYMCHGIRLLNDLLSSCKEFSVLQSYSANE